MTATFRAGDQSDAVVLDQLYETVFCDTFAHLYAPEDLNAFLASYGVDDWRGELADSSRAFRVAEVGGAIVGYAKLCPMKLPVETPRPALVLDQLYVVKQHHGAGIAVQLMDWVLAEARRRGAEEIYLTVFTENHRARRFYERYGFDYVGPYRFMVGNHADEDIIMRKAL